MQCYMRFTNKIKIPREVKRSAKVGQPSPDSFIDVPTSRKSARNVECSSSSQICDQPSRRNRYVLPEQCIMCKGENIRRIHILRRDSGKSSSFANAHQVS